VLGITPVPVEPYFLPFLLETISYDEFLRASHIVDHVLNDDLKWFIESGWEDDWKYNDHWNYEDSYLKIDEVGNIATSGLVKIVSPEIMVRDQDDWKMTDKYIVEGSELSVCITDIGKKIRGILKGFF